MSPESLGADLLAFIDDSLFSLDEIEALTSRVELSRQPERSAACRRARSSG
jgi:hypothetical protein